MVKCDKVDGNPCKCQLAEPCINYMVETIISNVLKLVLGTINPFETNELREFVQMPDAGRYIEIYIQELDKHRDVIGDVEPCIDYMVETIISSILKFVLGTISPAERNELREFVRMPNAGRYIEIYIQELDEHREVIGDVVLRTI